MAKRYEFAEIVLILTRSCNKKECYYCQVNKDYKVIFLEKNLISLIGFLQKNKIKKVRFLGGEPLLKFQIIQKIIKSLSAKDFTLNTNGLLLTPAKIEFFRKNKVKIILSWDGQEEDLIKNRKYSLKQINKLKKVLTDLKIYQEYTQINLTVSDKTVKNLLKNLFYIYNLGFENINILPVFYKFWPQEKIRTFQLELIKILINFNKLKNLELINLKAVSSLPLFKNSLLIDCDGKIFFSTAAIEKFFQTKRNDFIKGDILDKKLVKVSLADIGNYNRKIKELITTKFDSKILNSTKKINQIFENFITQYIKLKNK